ncbi:MAG: hypothetical protein LBJ44_08960 [Propionibacteriaceae bacterium]|jgi:hypothetical protein|nr:hypothetical protein [Propionibacteriaceae bacterium]
MRVFGTDWAKGLAEELGRDPRFGPAARMLRAVVRLEAPRRGLDLILDGGRVAVRPLDPADPFDFGLKASQAAWLELVSQPRTSLNQLVRRGDIELTGDRVAALLWWKPLFLIAQAARRLESDLEGSWPTSS